MLRLALLIVLTLASAPVAPARADDANSASLTLSARLGASKTPLAGGLQWRIFNVRAEPDGAHMLVYESPSPRPTATLPAGDYIVHAAFGLASAMMSVSLFPGDTREASLALAAGALRIAATRENQPLDPANVAVSIYVPERYNAEANLVYSKARPGDVIGVPEGAYHIVSTYLDTVGIGALGGPKTAAGGAAPTPSNSTASADVRVAAGKTVEVTLKHRFAKLTIKLVKAPGGEALANTTFTVLSNGGDIIRELIGAFPSLVLAEGDYIVVARHEAKTYQSTFPVKSGLDRDVEIVAKETNDQEQ